MINPFSDGEHRGIRPEATVLVIFGASGDLTHRKLIPALYNLGYDGYLPAPFFVIGSARSPFSDAAFRDAARTSVEKHSRRTLEADKWEAFASNIFYHQLDGNSIEHFKSLKEKLLSLEQSSGVRLNFLYYLATAPAHFGVIAKNLAAVGLVEQDSSGSGRKTQVVVEKPFGEDLSSAIELTKQLRECFHENQIFRIDHYLGKETVQNILVFRFANGLFEPLWNRQYIDHIQISVCETVGVESRAAYFDQTGIMRDIVQNHVLQMLALLCIEPPAYIEDSNGIRDEKVKVLRALKQIAPGKVAEHVVRAQYNAGYIEGQPVSAYQQEAGIAAGSKTESFVAMRLEIDNWRWAGVPIFVRAGKRLPKRITEIAIYFKRPPGSIFHRRHMLSHEPNVLSIQVQPDEGISLKMNSKPPGPRMRVRPVVMDFSYGGSFGVPSADAYERLLLDAMKGDATLFTRNDEIEYAWQYLMPILNAWKNDPEHPIYSYSAGSWGPEQAQDLLREQQSKWRIL